MEAATPRAILLTSDASDPFKRGNSDHVRTVLNDQKIRFHEIVSGRPEHKDQRDILFNISGKDNRGKIPQVFVQHSSDLSKSTFVGLYEQFMEIVELSKTEGVKVEDSKNFDKIFASCK